MIRRISVKGYKSLLNVSVQTAGLNVLVGSNASGKSSFLQVLLLLRQSSSPEIEDVTNLELLGGLFEAGTALDVLHPEADRKIEVEIEGDDGTQHSAVFTADVENINRARKLVANSSMRLPSPLSDRHGELFAYVNAERFGPRVVYKLPPSGHLLSGFVGMNGEYTTAFLAGSRQTSRGLAKDWYEILKEVEKEMPEDLDLDEGSQKNLVRLDLTVGKILSWLVPGSEYEALEQSFTDSARLVFIRDPSGTRTEVRPTNIGFGLSYVLPVITAALALSPGAIFIVENPEAHLHPLSQSRMGVFLALVAAAGVQIFVETHSDHIVNGIRLAVRYGWVPEADVRFISFRKNPFNDSSTLTDLSVRRDGQLSAWPEGFFDQIARDLSRL